VEVLERLEQRILDEVLGIAARFGHSHRGAKKGVRVHHRFFAEANLELVLGWSFPSEHRAGLM
jgi:hypothetical protein